MDQTEEELIAIAGGEEELIAIAGGEEWIMELIVQDEINDALANRAREKREHVMEQFTEMKKGLGRVRLTNTNVAAEQPSGLLREEPSAANVSSRKMMRKLESFANKPEAKVDKKKAMAELQNAIAELKEFSEALRKTAGSAPLADSNISEGCDALQQLVEVVNPQVKPVELTEFQKPKDFRVAYHSYRQRTFSRIIAAVWTKIGDVWKILSREHDKQGEMVKRACDGFNWLHFPDLPSEEEIGAREPYNMEE